MAQNGKSEMRTTRYVRIGALLALALTRLLHADEKDSAAATLKQTLQSRFLDIRIIAVKPSPVAGLFEVYTGDMISYVDGTGNFLLIGSLMDTRTRRNLTVDRVNERNAVNFDTLPLAQSIKVVKGNGKRRMAVFSDPDCPYCQQLEKQLASVSDVTIYTFLFPIASLHPEATNKAHAIWCAKDRGTTWTQWMQNHQALPPAPAKPCKDDPIETLHTLGDKLFISSTPTLFFANGKRVSGAIAAAQIEQRLNEVATPKTAAGQ